MSSPSPKDLYLHIPYCSGKCAYCSFFSGPPPASPENYVQTLIKEYRTRACEVKPLHTLYCGGGTPALLGCQGFRQLREAPFLHFEEDYEWTVELHPATISKPLLETLVECGVNRLSIGVQSFNDTTLEYCHRRHTVEMALKGIALARQFIPDTGIDLIAGLPSVTPQQWETTLDTALALQLPHLSIYGLSIEPGSFWHRQGIQPPDDVLLCEALTVAHEKLTAVGFDHYEISNYAQTGYRCKHNLNTWLGGDYLGLGEGAHSRLGCQRRDGLGHTIILTPFEDACERAFTSLRLKQPFDIQQIIRHFPLLQPFEQALQKKVHFFQQHHLLDSNAIPTARGFEVVDAMIRECYLVVKD